MKRFEDLLVWQKAQELFLELNAVFKNSKDFFFRDQILRAGLSISNNIAEGFERKSNKELRYFLFVAKGSSGEVRSMIYLAFQLNKIDDSQKIKFLKSTEEVSKMLSGLIQAVNKQL